MTNVAGQAPELERLIREAALDETLAETFPASDPLSTLPNPRDESVFDLRSSELERLESLIARNVDGSDREVRRSRPL